MFTICRIAMAVCLVCSAGYSVASTVGDPLFEDEAVLAVTLNAPLKKLARDRAKEPEYRPGTLAYTDADGTQQVFDLQVRPRGKSRRNREVCAFPPLRLNFRTKQLQDTLFENQNILKLVTHCKSSKKFESYLLKELLVYRLFNLLSDTSFRVRLLKVNYVDSEAGGKPYERYGFLIEHKNRMAARLDTEPVETGRIKPSELDSRQASIGELFQYLVSNADFSFIDGPPDEGCCHNAILLAGPAETYLPVPYDFDRTGLVSPSNSLPAEEFGQRTYRDRVFRGLCRDPQYLTDAIAETVAKRPELEAIVANLTELSERDRRSVSRFIEGFYKTVEDPKRRDRALKCRPTS